MYSLQIIATFLIIWIRLALWLNQLLCLFVDFRYSYIFFQNSFWRIRRLISFFEIRTSGRKENLWKEMLTKIHTSWVLLSIFDADVSGFLTIISMISLLLTRLMEFLSICTYYYNTEALSSAVKYLLTRRLVGSTDQADSSGF